MKKNNLAIESGVQADRRSYFPFVYISISTSKWLIKLFIGVVVLVIELSTKLSSRSSLVFLKALVERRWARCVVAIACVVSILPPFSSLNLVVGEWPRRWFRGCKGSEHLFDSGSEAIVNEFWGRHWRRRRRRFFEVFVRCVLCIVFVCGSVWSF